MGMQTVRFTKTCAILIAVSYMFVNFLLDYFLVSIAEAVTSPIEQISRIAWDQVVTDPDLCLTFYIFLSGRVKHAEILIVTNDQTGEEENVWSTEGPFSDGWTVGQVRIQKNFDYVIHYTAVTNYNDQEQGAIALDEIQITKDHNGNCEYMPPPPTEPPVTTPAPTEPPKGKNQFNLIV
jgi:hypothetical protein